VGLHLQKDEQYNGKRIYVNAFVQGKLPRCPT